MEQQGNRRDLADRWAAVAGEAYADASHYLASIPESDWDGPTGCADWDVRTLAGHIAGEAVWFPNLVRGATAGEQPLPMHVYDELARQPSGDMVRTIADAARRLTEAVTETSPRQLDATLDLGWTRMPLWRATSVAAQEATLHGWDLRARRQAHPTIPADWATTLVDPMTRLAPHYAHRNASLSAAGTYFFQVQDVPVETTITVINGTVSVGFGAIGAPDLEIRLDADAYIRLLSGRLDPARDEALIHVSGDTRRLDGLLRVFAGIANEQ